MKWYPSETAFVFTNSFCIFPSYHRTLLDSDVCILEKTSVLFDVKYRKRLNFQNSSITSSNLCNICFTLKHVSSYMYVHSLTSHSSWWIFSQIIIESCETNRLPAFPQAVYVDLFQMFVVIIKLVKDYLSIVHLHIRRYGRNYYAFLTITS